MKNVRRIRRNVRVRKVGFELNGRGLSVGLSAINKPTLIEAGIIQTDARPRSFVRPLLLSMFK